jgi:hypothetical protein
MDEDAPAWQQLFSIFMVTAFIALLLLAVGPK